jgi:beta-RFAP synthase
MSERALAFARRFVDTFPPAMFVPHRFVIEQAPPEHVGLGSGTQLGLAVARALAFSIGQECPDIFDLARRVGRGERSAVGVIGFDRGGFLVDAACCENEGAISPPTRFSFPEHWPILLVTPRCEPGLHGTAERRAFEVLEGDATVAEDNDLLTRPVFSLLVQSLDSRDLAAFGEALHEFNARIGEMFASVQGGTYSNELSGEVVAFLRGRGIRGVGQSSWGPTVFAILEDPEEGEKLIHQLRRHFAFDLSELLVTRACNRGATVMG